jgi:hypothetical protein
MKRAQNYYPIFAINTEVYFKTLKVSHKLFQPKDTIVSHLQSIILNNYERTSQSKLGRPLDITLVRDFVTRHPTHKIIHKYVNKRNMCYAIMLEGAAGNVYLPIEYVVNIPDGLTVEYGVYNREQYPVKYSALKTFLKELDGYIAGAHRNYAPVVLKHVLYRQGQVVGVRTEHPSIYYLSEYDGGATELTKLELRYDFNDVNVAIMNRRPQQPDNRTKLLGKSLYDNYLYQLFLLEFINYTEKERNKPIREQIRTVLGKADFRRKVFEAQRELRNLLKNFPSDIATLQTQISMAFYGGDKKLLLETIDSTVYEFDKITINRLRQLNERDMKLELRKIAQNFTDTTASLDLSKVTVPNIYLPCEYITNGQYCQGKKLIIQEAVLDSFLEILASDLLNPIKHKYLTSGLFTDNIIDYFKFETGPEELVTITKL